MAVEGGGRSQDLFQNPLTTQHGRSASGIRSEGQHASLGQYASSRNGGIEADPLEGIPLRAGDAVVPGQKPIEKRKICLKKIR